MSKEQRNKLEHQRNILIATRGMIEQTAIGLHEDLAWEIKNILRETQSAIDDLGYVIEQLDAGEST
jgi:hypothetical protein